MLSIDGIRPIGHISMHLPHLMQGPYSSVCTTPSSGITSIPEVPFVTGTSRVERAKPIIGPPDTTLPALSLKPPHSSTISEMRAPIFTIKFAGFFMPSPVTVTTLSINGLPYLAASYTASAVPTFCTTTLISMGSPLGGTSLPVRALISIFSAPCGYLTSSPHTSMFGSFFAAAFILSIASGLLFSIPINPLLTPRMRISIFRPSTISADLSIISL